MGHGAVFFSSHDMTWHRGAGTVAPPASPRRSINPLATVPGDRSSDLPNPTKTSAHNEAISEDTMPQGAASTVGWFDFPPLEVSSLL